MRITTHYDNRVDHSAFSVIHEGGHGLYEMGIDDKLTQTILGQGASMAMHESQSRFMENCIGRSKAFWKPIYGKVQEIFPKELGNISLDQFIEGINKVEPGLIRINADELTYSPVSYTHLDVYKRQMELQFTLNGKKINTQISPDQILLELVRELGCYSVKRGCDTSNCGLCTVLVDSKPVLSCSTLAAVSYTHLDKLGLDNNDRSICLQLYRSFPEDQ